VILVELLFLPVCDGARELATLLRSCRLFEDVFEAYQDVGLL
jgi:hypothetical protein